MQWLASTSPSKRKVYLVRIMILLTSWYMARSITLLSLGFRTQKMVGNRKLKLEKMQLTVKSR